MLLLPCNSRASGVPEAGGVRVLSGVRKPWTRPLSAERFVAYVRRLGLLPSKEP